MFFLLVTKHLNEKKRLQFKELLIAHLVHLFNK